MGKFFDDLRVPTHPQYDWAADPSAQAEYVNPVTLSNCEIRWANAAITLTQKVVGINKQLGQTKVALQASKDALDDFEQDLLREHPAPAGATKSLKLLDAYLAKTAFETGKAEVYRGMVAGIRSGERALQLLEIDAENCRHVWQTLKLAGEHAMTHLAFVKSELQAARKGI